MSFLYDDLTPSEKNIFDQGRRQMREEIMEGAMEGFMVKNGKTFTVAYPNVIACQMTTAWDMSQITPCVLLPAEAIGGGE